MQPTLPADDWPTLGGGIFRANAQAPKLSLSFKELWRKTLPGCSLASPIAFRGRLILGSNDGALQSWDMLTGETCLTHSATGSPCVGLSGLGTAILCAHEDGTVTAFNANQNSIIWQQRLPARLGSPPCFTGQGVFIADVQGNLYELDRISGGPRKLAEGAGECMGGLLPLRQGLIWLSGSSLISYDPRDGKELWPARDLSFISQAALCSDGQYVFAQGFNGELCAYDLASGQLIWSLKLSGQSVSTPAWSGNTLICACLDGEVYCINAKDGSRHWSQPLGAVISSSPAVSSGHAAVGLRSGRVLLLDLAAGETAAELDLGRPRHIQPIIWRDILITLGLDGEAAVWSSD